MLEPLLKESSDKTTSKPEMENVEREKQEYKLIGSYLRTRGLKLFAYNSLKNKLFEVEIEHGDTLHLLPDENGKLRAVDLELEKATVDSRDIHFEALNWKNAEKRLRNFKKGRIKELCNLREPGDGINFY
jgi:hypothetical protein